MKRKKTGRTIARVQKPIKRGFTDLIAVQVKGMDSMGIAIRRGLYASTNTLGLTIPHEDLAGAIENPNDMGSIVVKVGLLAFAHLIGYNLAYGADGLARAACEWAGIDTSKLISEAEEDERKLAAQVEVQKQLNAAVLSEDEINALESVVIPDAGETVQMS